MKKVKIIPIITLIIGFFFGLSFVIVSYANSYNSEEISYDNSTSHASAINVKDAIDYLYSHGSCGEGMSCLESPIVTITVNGPGSVNKTNLSVPINGSNKFIVTPNEGYVLHSINCDGGYTLENFNTLSNSTNELASQVQEIIVNNQRLFDDSTCTVTFGTSEISVSSTNLHEEYKGDTCNSDSSGCICYQIKNNISDFIYGSHTGCNFKSGSTSCYHTYGDNNIFSCSNVYWNYYVWNDGSGSSACSGVITCAT